MCVSYLLTNILNDKMNEEKKFLGKNHTIPYTKVDSYLIYVGVD